MYTVTTELVQDHQHELLAEADRARRGDRLARTNRLNARARRAASRSRRANAHVS
jgi:hypothetical protein